MSNDPNLQHGAPPPVTDVDAQPGGAGAGAGGWRQRRRRRRAERRVRRGSGVPRSQLGVVDLVGEATSSISRRPTRAILTALGTVVGVGAFVATTGLASTARAQVGASFDALKATEVRVIDAQRGEGNPFPADVAARTAAMVGLNDAGVYWTVEASGLDVRATATPSRRPSTIPVVAVEPGALRATLPQLSAGTLIDEFHDSRAEHVVILGRVAAGQLNVTRVDNEPAVFIGNTAFTVIGILDDVARNPDLLLAAIIPAQTAAVRFPSQYAEYTVLADVDPGAAEVVGSQIREAIRPQDPGRLQVLVPPDPKTLRQAVEGDITSLLYGLAGLALLVGMIGIANTTLVAVMERRAEIGVRRALGALRRHIAAQFLVESSVLGLVGGLLGAALGITAVAVVSAARQWTTTIDPRLALIAPLAGAATGLLAGLHPAIRASRITPATALRSS